MKKAHRWIKTQDTTTRHYMQNCISQGDGVYKLTALCGLSVLVIDTDKLDRNPAISECRHCSAEYNLTK